MKVCILLTAIALTFSSAAAEAVERKFALVIGNSVYENVASLDNPVNDATLISTMLKTQGFIVRLETNMDYQAMRRSISRMAQKIRQVEGDTTFLFYYAGHGMQFAGENYLIPVNALISTDGDIDIEGLSLSEIMTELGRASARTTFVILDACRNNPFKIANRTARGLAPFDAPANSLIAFSTAPGTVAFDGAEGSENSPYTLALSELLTQPGIKAEDAFKSVRKRLVAETNGEQVPWESSSLVDDVFFGDAPNSQEAPRKNAQAIRNQEAIEVWRSLDPNPSVRVIDAFLRRFGDTPMGEIAKAKRQELLEHSAKTEESVTAKKIDYFPKEAHDLSILSEKPTVELNKYVSGFRDGQYAFSLEIDGFKAAKRLKFSRRFASLYNNLKHSVENKIKENGSASIDDFEKVAEQLLSDEKKIDNISKIRRSDIALIVVLRSFQEGISSYPSISRGMPDVDDFFEQLVRAFPDIKGNANRGEFKHSFEAVHRELTAILEQRGVVTAQDITATLRKQILAR